MAKKILFGDEARREMKIGGDVVGDATKITVGPKGRNVVFDKESIIRKYEKEHLSMGAL